MALDDRLVAALRSGAIKLLRADFLRRHRSLLAGGVIPRRQDLEALERRTPGLRVFLTPDEAVCALRANGRHVGAVTYGWTTPSHPDPTGHYLAAVCRFLDSPLGAHITALFWE